jgi:predicted RNA methylase
MRAVIYFRKPAPVLLLAFALALAVPAEGKNVLFASTPKVVVDTMLMMGEVDASDNVVDLGSGDGRIPIIAAKEFHANAVGIEYDPDLIARSRENAVRKRIVLKRSARMGRHARIDPSGRGVHRGEGC